MSRLGMRETWARRDAVAIRATPRRPYAWTAPVAELERSLAVLLALAERHVLFDTVNVGIGYAALGLGILASLPAGNPGPGAVGMAVFVLTRLIRFFTLRVDPRRVALASAYLRSLPVASTTPVSLRVDLAPTERHRNKTGPGTYRLAWLHLEAALEAGVTVVWQRTEHVTVTMRGRRTTWSYAFEDAVRFDLPAAPAGAPGYRQGTPLSIAPDARSRLRVPEGTTGTFAEADPSHVSAAFRCDRRWAIGHEEGAVDAVRLGLGFAQSVLAAAQLPISLRTPGEPVTAWIPPLRRRWLVLASLALTAFFAFGVVETGDHVMRAMSEGRTPPMDRAGFFVVTVLGSLTCASSGLLVVISPWLVRRFLRTSP